ncbi:hypothetical protein DC522_08440 [Microvirga sp. KLBC 81]|uniref:TRAP transporter small permease n=1 Tax=Microvirga sp. KLBC 81 TaxID=1862707 RepID=UPI000D509770|nr:TRAP transporter small permease [Microvirga sp. KLBC 81]PVE24937.1 hypothetical protein DC522_08440 [Microvirga sp. KLBC 81]
MSVFLRAYAGLLRWTGYAEAALLTVLMAVIVLSIALQVVMRFVFGHPMVWVEEVSTYAFVWITFMGASVGLKQVRHVKVELLNERLSPGGHWRMKLVGYVAVLAAVGYLAFKTPGVIRIESFSSTVSLPVEIPRAWFYSIPLLYCCLMMAATALYEILSLLVQGDEEVLVSFALAEEMHEPSASPAAPQPVLS